MNDSISRQAAIDAIVNCTNCGDEKTLRAYVAKHSLDNGWSGGILEAIDAVIEVPSAQPERAKGKWYKPVGMMPPEYAGVYRCSKCDEIAMRDWKHHKQVLSNFCPNCGVDMRGEPNETD